MTINAMPSPTWNRLRVNDARIRGISLPNEPFVQTEVPAGISCVYTQEALSAAVSDILTGIGGQMDALTAESGRCLYLKTDAGFLRDTPVRLHLQYPSDGGLLTVAADLADDSVLTVIMDASMKTTNEETVREPDVYTGVQLKIRVGKRARLCLYQIEMLGTRGTSLFDLGISCADDAKVEIRQLFLGQGRIYSGCRTALSGDGSILDIAVGYRAGRDSLLDMNYVAVHEGKKTRSMLSTSGVLRDNAYKTFRGTIDFAAGAKGAVGDEKEEVLLLDDDVVNRTVPVILCAEEDVAGNHGATIGKIDDELLFYLQSRGLSEREVYEMLARAKVDAVLVLMADADARALAEQYLEGGDT